MPIIFHGGPLGSVVGDEMTRRQAFAGLAGVGTHFKDKKRLRGLVGAIEGLEGEELDAALEQMRGMTANDYLTLQQQRFGGGTQRQQQQRSNQFGGALSRIRDAGQNDPNEITAVVGETGPSLAPQGLGPMRQGMDEALALAQKSGMNPQDYAALSQYADQIIAGEQESLARQGLAGRMVEIGGMAPELQAPMAFLSQMAMDPSVDRGEILKAGKEAFRDYGKLNYEKGLRSMQAEGAIANLTLLNNPEFEKIIPSMIPKLDPLTGEMGMVPNPMRERFAMQQFEILAESGFSGIPYMNSSAGTVLDGMERGAMGGGFPGPGMAGPPSGGMMGYPGGGAAGPPSATGGPVGPPATGAAYMHDAVPPPLGLDGPLAKAIDAEREAKRSARTRELKAQRQEWGGAKPAVKAELLVQATEQIQQLVQAGAKPDEALAAVLQDAANKSPFFEPGDALAVQAEFAADLRATLALLQAGEEIKRERLIALYGEEPERDFKVGGQGAF